MRDDDVRHLARHRHQIVGHRAVEKLRALVVEAFLEERNGVAYEAGKRRFEMDLIYRSPLIVPGGKVLWTFEDSPNVSHILTNATAGGQKAGQIWYMAGHTADTTKPSGADFHAGGKDATQCIGRNAAGSPTVPLSFPSVACEIRGDADGALVPRPRSGGAGWLRP